MTYPVDACTSCNPVLKCNRRGGRCTRRVHRYPRIGTFSKRFKMRTRHTAHVFFGNLMCKSVHECSFNVKNEKIRPIRNNVGSKSGWFHTFFRFDVKKLIYMKNVENRLIWNDIVLIYMWFHIFFSIRYKKVDLYSKNFRFQMKKYLFSIVAMHLFVFIIFFIRFTYK